MKMIKTPEEIGLHHGIINGYTVHSSLSLAKAGFDAAMKEYHAQFSSTSEEVEKAKEGLWNKYFEDIEEYLPSSLPTRFKSDLNALIELVQNETKDAPKMPTEEVMEELNSFANWLWDNDRLRINSQIEGIKSADEMVICYIETIIKPRQQILSHLQEPEAPVEEKESKVEKLAKSVNPYDQNSIKKAIDKFKNLKK
jgi:hypothetical protein